MEPFAVVPRVSSDQLRRRLMAADDELRQAALSAGLCGKCGTKLGVGEEAEERSRSAEARSAERDRLLAEIADLQLQVPCQSRHRCGEGRGHRAP